MSEALLTINWPELPRSVRAASTTRLGGVSLAPYESLNLGDHVGDAPEPVAENRRRLVDLAGLPSPPVWLRQVHGTRVLRLRPDSVAGQEADACWTDQPGVVCAVLTADCLPVLLADDTGRCVAAAHAGWRGLVGGVLEATVAALPVAPATLSAWLGPAIGPAAFQVGDEVRAAFVAVDPQDAAHFRADGSRWRADLFGLARARLHRLGVHRVQGGDACTWSDPRRFHSHRRDGVGGRMASLIWRLPLTEG